MSFNSRQSKAARVFLAARNEAKSSKSIPRIKRSMETNLNRHVNYLQLDLLASQEAKMDATDSASSKIDAILKTRSKAVGRAQKVYVPPFSDIIPKVC
ncbi:hypothetical protein FRC02_009478 [Tulasnella sp. 418]|nr:hypothetical protein FRC02_009478 [Tulasnella sp. 418]